jgi:acetylglutamate kinase
MRLVETLLQSYFVPIVASIGIDRNGRLLNVNADTMAGHFARSVRARRLVIAGSTAGVLDDSGRTIPLLDTAAIETLVSDRTATAGMIAKLRACQWALAGGVEDVVIVDGRDQDALRAAASGAMPDAATRVVTTVGTRS